MPQTTRLWQVDNGDLTEVPASSLDAEEQLEDWLEEDISILSDDLLVIGRQVPTDFGGKLDLLCIDEAGDLVVIELKRDKTPREVVAQGLDYASWVVDLSGEDVDEQAESYLDAPLEDKFREAFDLSLPEVLNESHRILIVGSRIDAQSERIIDYLSDEHGVNINAATFQYHESEKTGGLLSRVFLIEPSQVETRSRRKGSSNRKPDLTREELQQLAEEQGIGPWYRTLVQEVESLFQGSSTTRSSLSIKADLEDTRFGIQRGSVFTLWPDPSRWPDDRQEESDGLYFRLYTHRVAALFEIEEERVRAFLPENHDDWQYADEDIENEYSGVDGVFQDEEEVETFISGLKELASPRN